MQFTHNREQLLDACTIADGATAARSTMPILGCIKIAADGDTITVMATDNEIGLRYEMECQGIEKGGSGVFPPDKLLPILRQAGVQEVEFKSKSGGIEIKTKMGRFAIAEQDADTFPDVLGVPGDGGSVAVGRQEFHDALARTITCVDKTEATAPWAVTGVLLELDGDKLILAGTDTRRLAVATIGNVVGERAKVGVLIPRKTVAVILKAIHHSDESTVTIQIGDRGFSLQCGKLTINSRLLEGKFPPYRDIIPKKPAMKFQLPREDFHNATSQAAIMKEDDTRRIDIRFANGEAELTAQSSMGKSNVKVEVPDFTGKELEVGFNPDYLLDAMRSCTGENIEVEASEGTKPVVFRDGANYLHLIMPLSNA